MHRGAKAPLPHSNQKGGDSMKESIENIVYSFIWIGAIFAIFGIISLGIKGCNYLTTTPDERRIHAEKQQIEDQFKDCLTMCVEEVKSQNKAINFFDKCEEACTKVLLNSLSQIKLKKGGEKE